MIILNKLLSLLKPKPKPSGAVLIFIINDIKQTEWGFSRRDKMLILRRFCQDNPGEVAKLIFSSLEERHKEEILFYYSLDNLGSCALDDQPFWSRMVRDCILPRQNELSLEMREQLDWWFMEKPNYNPERRSPQIG